MKIQTTLQKQQISGKTVLFFSNILFPFTVHTALHQDPLPAVTLNTHFYKRR